MELSAVDINGALYCWLDCVFVEETSSHALFERNKFCGLKETANMQYTKALVTGLRSKKMATSKLHFTSTKWLTCLAPRLWKI